MRARIVIPVVAFLTVNIPPWFGFSYLYVIFQWATFQVSLTQGGNLAFPITYASAVAVLIFSSYRFRTRTKLSLLHSLALGSGLSLAGIALFEEIWQAVGYYYYPSVVNGATNLSGHILNATWVLLSVTSFDYWRVSKKFVTVATLFVLSWVAWIGIGFPQLFQANVNGALLANSSVKILSLLVFLSLVNFGFEPRETPTIQIEPIAKFSRNARL